MAKKYNIYFVDTARIFLLLQGFFENSGLRIESFAILKMSGVSTKYKLNTQHRKKLPLTATLWMFLLFLGKQ